VLQYAVHTVVWTLTAICQVLHHPLICPAAFVTRCLLATVQTDVHGNVQTRCCYHMSHNQPQYKCATR
jgi:hypothetical protein